MILGLPPQGALSFRVSASEQTIRNWSLTLGELADSAAKQLQLSKMT